MARRQCAQTAIDKLVLSNTSCYFPDKNGWNDRLKLVREKGVAAFAPANMERWFTKGFRERAPQAVAQMQDMFAPTALEGYLRLRRGGARHGSSPAVAEDHRADFGHRRPARSGDAARRQ